MIKGVISDKTSIAIQRQAKTCTNCLEYKSFDGFHKSNMASDGRHSMCRKCRGLKNYQLLLQKQIRYKSAGFRTIKYCPDCGDLFRQKAKEIICRRCI